MLAREIASTLHGRTAD